MQCEFIKVRTNKPWFYVFIVFVAFDSGELRNIVVELNFNKYIVSQHEQVKHVWLIFHCDSLSIRTCTCNQNTESKYYLWFLKLSSVCLKRLALLRVCFLCCCKFRLTMIYIVLCSHVPPPQLLHKIKFVYCQAFELAIIKLKRVSYIMILKKWTPCRIFLI